MEEYEGMDGLLRIMARLRENDGCPWDRVQTHESLKQYFLEEAYEVAEAIDNRDNTNLCEELGDTLLQVVFHSQIAREEGAFDFSDVVRGISEKMIRRHPHVFGQATAETATEVEENWEAIKRSEKGQATRLETVRSVPRAMPALMRAQKILKKADFPTEHAEKMIGEHLAKIGDSALSEGEIGDLLLAVTLLARKFQVNAELALTNATEQFINRFEGMRETTVFQDLDPDTDRS